MKNILFVVFLFISIFVLSISDYQGVKKYDCGMAEWHPDIPNAVKEECRRRNKDDWNKNQQDNKKKLIHT